MNKNMGSADKLIRVLIAALIVFLFYNGTISGTLGIILLVFAGIFVLTSFISFCPLYTLLGISTCPIKNKKS
ncbi:YgaP family membrane protein [Flavobacterium sp.]